MPSFRKRPRPRQWAGGPGCGVREEPSRNAEVFLTTGLCLRFAVCVELYLALFLIWKILGGCMRLFRLPHRRLGGPSNREVFSHSSEARTPRSSCCWQMLFPVRAASPWPHVASSRVQREISCVPSSSYKATTSVGLGPHSYDFLEPCKRPHFQKQPRCGLALQHMKCVGGHTSVRNSS